jgi:hypothetical protein
MPTNELHFDCCRCLRRKSGKQAKVKIAGVGGVIRIECDTCHESVRQKILRYVQSGRWRLETTIIRYVCKYEGTWDESRVIDELFHLVQEKKLEWFGAEDSLSKPLKYRYLKGIYTNDNAINLAS